MKDELIDTNILVYAYDKSEKNKFEIANSLLSEIWENGIGVTTLQNLTEFFVVVTKKVENPISKKQAEIIINDVMNSSKWIILRRTKLTMKLAMEFCRKYNIHLWDTLIAAVMKEYDIKTIITENTSDFNKMEGIIAKNPFTKLS